MSSVLQDLRLAVRQLRRSGSFTLTVIVTLALGIGLNAAIFTMVDCVLLRPLGYHDADRIYSLNTRFLDEGRSIAKMGGSDFVDLARSVRSLEHVAYYNGGKDGLQLDGRSLYLDISYVSPDFGQVMGVEPMVGRLFHAEVDGRKAMVSSAFAREHFGEVAGAMGKAVKSGQTLYTIVGVLPDGFSFPGKTQVWIEDPAAPENLNRTAYNQRAIGKANPGVTAEVLNAEMAAVSKQLGATYPEDKLKALEAVSLQEQLVGKIRPTLRLLMGSVVVILLIVCANITHLQLVRATQLRREVTIRTALGATRSALAKRAAMEVLLLAAGGCAAGVLIALPALRLLVRLAPQDIPRLADVRLNLEVIGFSFLVSVVTMGLTALLPLWRSWRLDPASAMKQDSARGTESRGSGRLRQGLIVGEVALTLMLSVAALLLVRQLIAEANQDLGFAPDKLVLLDTHNGAGEAGQAWVNALNRMVDDVRAVPGVESAAAVSGAPMGLGRADVSYAVRGKSEFTAGAKLPDANIMPMTPGYFETMGIRMIAGRGINDADREGSERVLVISQTMATQSFAGENPVGRQIMCGYDEVNPTWWTIVGVVSDVRQDSPASAPAPSFYVPIVQHPARASDMEVVVRTRMDASVMSATLEKHMKQQFPAVAVQSTTMRENIGESERAQRFRTLLFGSFAGVSILLAITGMYGVTAYTVAQKRFEFALRFALGAQRRQVLGSVLRSALAVAAIGVVGGVALSLALMRVMGNLLGKMPTFDPVSYAVAAAGVLLIAVAATLLPAQRAAMVDPMQVLRDE
jgi:putative ABC transport system permease protein